MNIHDWILHRKCIFEARRAEARPPVSAYYLDGWWAHREASIFMREAQGLRALWSQMPIEIDDDELFVGSVSVREVVDFHYGGGTHVRWDLAEEYVSAIGDSIDKEELFAKLRFVDDTAYHAANAEIFTPEQNASIAAGAATSTWFGGHMILDYETILAIGLDGYAARFDEYERESCADLFAAMRVLLSGVQTYILRYAACAKNERMASDIAFIAHHPPRTLWQGMQLVYFMHILNGADSFGRFDYYLYHLTDDIPDGEVLKLLCDFWVKIEQANAIQNMTIGGLTPAGEIFYTRFTKLCLTATRLVGYKGPNLCLRVTQDMPDGMWTEALECLSTGQGLPAIYNDALYVDMLTRAGYPLTEARGYCLAGCSQVMLSGKCNFMNDIGLYNIAKVVELTLRNGFDPRTNAQVGLKTGDPREFTDFVQLLDAFYAQNMHFIYMEADINDADTAYRAQKAGYVMRSLFVRGCVESGVPVMQGGAMYNNIELEIIGLSNAADSLYAVKKAVFEDKKVTIAQLIDALDADFNGVEPLRQYLKYGIDKFGNDVAAVDNLRAEISCRTYGAFNAISSTIGGVYVPGEVIFVAHEYAGAWVGATPDGRKAYQVLADSMGAMQGLDKHGPTALMRSAAKVCAKDYFLTTAVLNMRFTASLWRDSQARIRQLFEAYFMQGGTQLQINMFDAQTLKAATEDPENYRSLVVRVGGYSDYFVNLSPALQMEIIERTEMMA